MDCNEKMKSGNLTKTLLEIQFRNLRQLLKEMILKKNNLLYLHFLTYKGPFKNDVMFNTQN